MKSVQKFGSLLLAALMILSLTACGSKTSNDTPAQTPSNGTTTEDTPAETPDDAATGDADNTASGSKVLVVYKCLLYQHHFQAFSFRLGIFRW